MNTKTRVLTIRLSEKISKYPAYAERIGLTVHEYHNKTGSQGNRGDERIYELIRRK